MLVKEKKESTLLVTLNTTDKEKFIVKELSSCDKLRFLIPIYLKSDVVLLKYFQLWILFYQKV